MPTAAERRAAARNMMRRERAESIVRQPREPEPQQPEPTPVLERPVSRGGIAPIQPPPEQEVPAGELLKGFNTGFAELIGAPVELVDQGLRAAGTSMLDEPGDAIDAVMRGFESVGIRTTRNDVEGFRNKVGRNAFHGALMLLGMGGAGRTMSSLRTPARPTPAGPPPKTVTTTPVRRQDVTDVVESGAQAVTNRPGAAVAAEVSGATGAEAGAEGAEALFGPKARPMGAVAGGITGGVTGGTAATMPRRTLRSDLPTESTPPLQSRADAGRAVTTAAQKLDQANEALDKLDATVLRPFRTLDPDDVSESGRRTIERAAKAARGHQAALWRGVPDRVKADIDASAAEIDDIVTNTPTAQRRDIPSFARSMLTRTRKDPTTGAKIRIKAMSAKELQGVRSRLLETARRARAAGQANKARISSKLAEAIRTDLNNAPIDNEAYAAARAFSARYNDMFTRGPIGRVLRFNAAGEETVPENVTMAKIMRDPRGPAAIRQLADDPDFGSKQLLEDAKNALRADFGEAAEQGKGARFLGRQTTRRALRNLDDTAKEMVDAARGLRATTEAREELRKNALARFTRNDPDPQVAVRRLMNSANPANDVIELRRAFKGNRDALEGLKSGVLEDILTRNNFSGERLSRSLQQPRMQRMLRALLGPDEMRRFERIVNHASALEAQQAGRTPLSAGLVGLRLMSRVIGAQVGRQVAQATGGGTVQTPGLVASQSARIFDHLVEGVPASKLLADAVIDPRIERVLLMRAPAGLRQTRSMMRRISNLLGASTAGPPATAEEDEGEP